MHTIRRAGVIPSLMFGAGLVLFIIFAVLLLLPLESRSFIQVANGSLLFTSDRASVFAPGDCVTLRWETENINSLYLNERGVIGVGMEIFCTGDSATPTFRVVFQDGSIQEYPLLIHYSVERVELWVVGVSSLVLSVLGGGLFLLAQRSQSVKAYVGGAWGISIRLTQLLTFMGALLIMLVLILAILEGILRLYFGFVGSEQQRVSYVYSREMINALNASTIIPLPEVDYAPSPDLPTHSVLGYRHGLSSEEIAIPKPEGTFRIVAMGGSNTYGFFLAPQDAYPAQLERLLRDDYGYTNVEVINAGTAGYTSFQILTNFALRYLELEPDLVIYYESSNDVRLRERDPDCYRGYNIARGLNPQGVITTGIWAQPLSPSVLWRFISIQAGWMRDPARQDLLYETVPIACGQTSSPYADEFVYLNPPVYLRRNLESIVGIARVHQIDVLLATWAYHESANNVDQYWKDAVAENNAVIREVAAQYGLPYIDYAEISPQDSDAWLDYLHHSMSGTLVQAQTFAAYLDAQGLIPLPNTANE